MMMMQGSSLLSSFAKKSNVIMSVTKNSSRSISLGTNLLSSDVTLQKARPWFMSDSDGSNMAVDNSVSMKDLFEGRLVALFGVPAPFTGTCSLQHFPGYQQKAKALKEAGVDSIVCYAVSDPYAHHGWSLSLNNDDEDIQFLADHEGKWAKAFGVDTTYDAASLGLRSIRFSMLVDNGEVKAFNVVDDATKDAEVILEEVKKHTGK